MTDRIIKGGSALHRQKPVFNVRGSIFQWANEGRRLVGPDGKETDKVNPVSKFYGMAVSPSRWKF